MAIISLPPSRSKDTAYLSYAPGIHKNCEHSVAVTFNVIIPLNYWLWDDRTQVNLRFGDPRLGGWKNDVGTFSVLRYNFLVHIKSRVR